MALWRRGMLATLLAVAWLMAGPVGGSPSWGGTAWAQGRRVALVIGNARYAEGGAVPAARAGATAMADTLRRAGFDVAEVEDADRRALESALDRFLERLVGADLGFLFYSGWTLGLDGRGFLLPADARLASAEGLAFDTIAIDPLLRRMQATGRRGVVVIDALVPNPLAGRLAATLPPGRAATPAPGLPMAVDHLLVAYGQRPGAAPMPAGDDGPSVFAAALSRAMRQPGADLRGALDEAGRAVVERTRGAQRPWVQDRLDGPVPLAPPTVATAAPPARTSPAPPPPSPSPPSLPAPSSPPVVEPFEGAYVVVRATNLRQGPDGRSPVLGVLPRDATVSVTGRAAGGHWLRVGEAGRGGFAYAGNLAPAASEPAEPPADAAAPPPPAPDAVKPGVYMVRRTATMFAVPQLGARGVRDLPEGALVTVVGDVAGTSWVHVRDRSEQDGYVGAGTLAPVTGYGSSIGVE